MWSAQTKPAEPFPNGASALFMPDLIRKISTRPFCYTPSMDTKFFWKEYVGDLSPLDLMARFESTNPERCAAHFVTALPEIYGVVRRQSWKDTFTGDVQYRKSEITAAIARELDATREEWEPCLDERKATLILERRLEKERQEREQLEEEEAERLALKAAEQKADDEARLQQALDDVAAAAAPRQETAGEAEVDTQPEAHTESPDAEAPGQTD